jgi:hypothetical protein
MNTNKIYDYLKKEYKPVDIENFINILGNIELLLGIENAEDYKTEIIVEIEETANEILNTLQEQA